MAAKWFNSLDPNSRLNTKNADFFFNLLKCLYQIIFEKAKKAEKSQNDYFVFIEKMDISDWS